MKSSAVPSLTITHRDLARLKSVRKPFSRPGWIFELKYDGFRVLAEIAAHGVRLSSRRGTNLMPCFPEIVGHLAGLPHLILDGELVVLDDRGHPQFDRLARRFCMKRDMSIEHAAKTDPACLFAFDLLAFKGHDIRKLPLERRKSMLKKAVKGAKRIRYLDHIGEAGERLFEHAERLQLEGIVAKPIRSPYCRGYASSWLKVKTSAGRATDEERRKWNEA
jgi:bifunctional non-homologous end joining protein LigD